MDHGGGHPDVRGVRPHRRLTASVGPSHRGSRATRGAPSSFRGGAEPPVMLVAASTRQGVIAAWDSTSSPRSPSPRAPRQDRRSDLRRHSRRHPRAGPGRPRRLRDARHDRPGHGGRRDHDQRVRRLPGGRPHHHHRSRLHPRQVRLRRRDLRRVVAIDKQSPDIAQGVNTAYETRPAPTGDQEQGAGDQGLMFGYATRRDAGADAAADHACAPHLPAARRGPQSGEMSYLRPDGKTPGHRRVRGRRAGARRRGRRLDAARAGDRT